MFYKKMGLQAPNFGGKASGMNNKAIKQGSSSRHDWGEITEKNICIFLIPPILLNL